MLTGRLARGDERQGRTLVLLHGHGGSCNSRYLFEAARAAHARGFSVLRLNARGADKSGEDMYHAGLWQDVAAAVSSPELAKARELTLMGFSLGGHLALRFAAEAPDPRLRAVVAVCPPLDLALAAQAFDRSLFLYRRYILQNLKAIYKPVSERWRAKGIETAPSPREVRSVSSLLEWDQRVIAPRHGFKSASDYYECESAASRLSQLAVPTLIANAVWDPMVRYAAVERALANVSPSTRVCRLEVGGHLGFPRGVDFGMEEAHPSRRQHWVEPLLAFLEQ